MICQSQAGRTSCGSRCVDDFGLSQSRYIGSQGFWEQNSSQQRETSKPQVGASYIFVSLNHWFVDLALSINFYLCPCVCVCIHTPHIGMQLEAKGVHRMALSRSNRQLRATWHRCWQQNSDALEEQKSSLTQWTTSLAATEKSELRAWMSEKTCIN